MLLPREAVKYIRTADLDAFAADASAKLRADETAVSLLHEATSAGRSESDVLLILQALQIAGVHTKAPPKAEFVATVPAGTPCPARPTQVVLREMLIGARREIIALGYEITELGLVGLLHEAALHCGKIIVLCDRGKGSASNLIAGWPSDRYAPDVYENTEFESSTFASMHCKTLLVDGEDLLVTSANFTFHGINANVEFGIRLKGADAKPVRTILLDLLNSGLFRRTQYSAR